MCTFTCNKIFNCKNLRWIINFEIISTGWNINGDMPKLTPGTPKHIHCVRKLAQCIMFSVKFVNKAFSIMTSVFNFNYTCDEKSIHIAVRYVFTEYNDPIIRKSFMYVVHHFSVFSIVEDVS